MTEKDSLSRRDHLLLEAYRSHKQFIIADGQALTGLDAVVAALKAGLIFKGDLGPFHESIQWFPLVLSVPVLWIIVAWKFICRQKKRYQLMVQIEHILGFSSQRPYRGTSAKEICAKNNIFLRQMHHCRVFIVRYSVVAVFHLDIQPLPVLMF